MTVFSVLEILNDTFKLIYLVDLNWVRILDCMTFFGYEFKSYFRITFIGSTSTCGRKENSVRVHSNTYTMYSLLWLK